MIYVLIGKTCSGKTTAFNKLISLGYKTVVNYTTRPMRINEINGKDHTFITEEEYMKLHNQELIVASKEFNGWFYGIDVTSIDNSIDQVLITSPGGYRDILERLGNEKVKGIYLTVPFDVQLLRGLNRKDNVNELMRRLASDELDFKDIEKDVHHIVQSSFKESALKSILKIIQGGHKNE